MSMERCEECGMAVDTDYYTEGVGGVAYLGDSTMNVYICEKCLEKEAVRRKWGIDFDDHYFPLEGC